MVYSNRVLNGRFLWLQKDSERNRRDDFNQRSPLPCPASRETKGTQKQHNAACCRTGRCELVLKGVMLGRGISGHSFFAYFAGILKV